MAGASIIHRGLSIGVAASLFFGAVPAAQPAPGLGGLSGGAARALGPGGVIIDYRAARTALANDELDVARVDDGLIVHVGDTEHRLALEPWELAEVLRVAHVVEDDGYLEVSIDPLSDGSKGLGTTPELVVGGEITSLGMALVQADVDFAVFCRSAADPANASLYRMAPRVRAMDLLEYDADYRRLTLDLVVPPVLRSQIRANIGTLAEAEPVTWTTGVEIHYATPQGQLVGADGDLIDDDIVAQSKRPYRELAHWLDAPGKRGRAVRDQVPALERIRTYALALTALDAHCRHERETCDTWRADALAAVKRSRARGPVIDDEEMDAYLSGVMGLGEADAWTNTRYEVVTAASPQQRALALLDELVYDTTSGWGDQELLAGLLAEPLVVEDPTTRLLLDFHRGLRFRDGRKPLPPTALLRMMRSVDDVVRDPRRATATREILAASVLATPWLYGSGVFSLAEHTMTECIQSLEGSAELARAEPQRRTAEQWLDELGRLERCRPHVPVADWVLLRIGASFHYAAGSSWAARARGHDEELVRAAYDRLRVLRAHERAMLTDGDEDGSKQTRSMIATLGEAIRD